MTLPLTYTLATLPWYRTELPPLPTTLLLALLTTLLTYQLTATLSDILLGTKPYHRYPIPYLQTSLLVHQSGPLPLLTALLRLDPLTRLYHRPSLPSTTSIARDPLPIRPGVILRLLLLVALAPSLNTLCLILPLRTSHELTFAQAGFTPVSLSATTTPPSVSVVSPYMANIPIRHAASDSQFTTLHLWTKPPYRNSLYQPKARVLLFTGRDSTLFLRLSLGRRQWSQSVHATLTSRTTDPPSHFRIQVNMSRGARDTLLEEAIRLMREVCGDASKGVDAVEEKVIFRSEDFSTIGALVLPMCRIGDEQADVHVKRIAGLLIRRISLVPSERMMIAPRVHERFDVERGSFADARDMVFVGRRPRNVPLVVLAILTAGVVVLRAVVGLIWNNDVEDAVLLVVKHTMGLGCCDSLLNVREKVFYDCKYQIGEEARLGLPVKGLTEVTEFRGGVVDAEGSFLQFDWWGVDDDFTFSNSDTM